MIDVKTIFSFLALLISLASFYFARKSWMTTNRPIIIAYIAPFDDGIQGNIAEPINIVIENTGNLPARNIKLQINEDELEKALSANIEESYKSHIKTVFSDKAVIPILGNGKKLVNSFGTIVFNETLAGKSCWKNWTRISITLSYEGLDGRKFENKNELLIGGTRGFAGGLWQKG